MRQIVSLEKEIVFKTMIGEICSISLEHDLSFINESEIEGNLIISGTYKMTEASTLEEEFNYKIPVEIMLTTNLLEDKRKIDINDFTYKIINEEALNIKVEILIEGLEKVDVTDIMEKDSELESVVLEKEPLKDEVKEECSVRESKDLEVIDTPKERKDEEVEDVLDANLVEPLEEVEVLEEEPLKEVKVMKDESEIEVNQENDNNTNKEVMDSIFSSFANTKETYSTYSIYILREDDSIDEVMNKYKVNREILGEYNDLENLKVGTKLIIPNLLLESNE